jgi:hypothetical protein
VHFASAFAAEEALKLLPADCSSKSLDLKAISYARFAAMPARPAATLSLLPWPRSTRSSLRCSTRSAGKPLSREGSMATLPPRPTACSAGRSGIWSARTKTPI